MSGSKGSLKKLDMNWVQIDQIIWNIVQTWNGSESGKQTILKTVSNQFNWTESQTNKACELHFNMYNKLKTK